MGQKVVKTGGFLGSLLCGLGGREAKKPRWMQVRTWGWGSPEEGEVVARVNSGEEPRWERCVENKGYQGARVEGVGWVVADDMVRRRWVRRCVARVEMDGWSGIIGSYYGSVKLYEKFPPAHNSIEVLKSQKRCKRNEVGII